MTDPRPLVLVVPMPPHVTNRPGLSRHWRTVHAEKRAYWETLDTIALTCRRVSLPGWPWSIPSAPASPLVRAALTSAMVLGGAMDDDNAIARHKPLCDWLVARGYLATDRRERKRDGASCRWLALPAQRVSRREPARITLTITPAPRDTAATLDAVRAALDGGAP